MMNGQRLLLLCALVLFFCGFGQAQAAAKTAIIGVEAGVTSLDPFSLTGIESYSSTGYVLEALARSNPVTGEMIPCLGLSWRLDPKNKSFTVKLRPNVFFHNGQKLTAADVKFTFDAYYDPAYKGATWAGMWEGIKSAKVIDEETITFTMKAWRYESFETLLTSLRILPKTFYSPADAAKFRTQIIGTGPFKFKSFSSDGKFALEPNPRWWGGLSPDFDLLIKKVPDAKLASEMMAKGQLDYYAPGAEYARNLTAKGFRLLRLPVGLGNGFGLDLNMREPIFQSRKLREALLLLWRREDLNRQVYHGELKLALDAFSPNTDTHPPGDPVKDDLARAQKLLKEDGWSDEDKDSSLEKTISGQKRNLRFKVLLSSSDSERWVTLYQRDAARAGVQVEIERAADDTQLYKRLEEGHYQALATGGGLMNEATRLAWHSQGPYNFGKYSNKEVDRLIEELEGEFELKKRRLIMRKIILAVRKDPPQIPGLYSPDQFYMTSLRLVIDPLRPSDPSRWKLN